MMIKDLIGQPVKEGAFAVWTAHNQQWLGKVVKVSAKRVVCTAIDPNANTRAHHFMPRLDKLLILKELPEQTTFWAMKG